MSIDKIRDYLKEYSYLRSIQALLHWDMETMMPLGAIKDRADRLSYISGKIHRHITAKKYSRLLKECREQKLKLQERKLLKELEWDWQILNAMPLKHVQEMTHAQTIATHVWAKARKENDWPSFLPHLQKLIDLKRREAGFFEVKKPYDALLKMYDKEFTSYEITGLFSDLKRGLLKLANEVEGDGTFVKVKDLKGPFDIGAQQDMSLYIKNLFCLPDTNSRLDVSAHPFSINISPSDQRITTRYLKNNLDSLGSTMHEVGHALYELNLPREWEGTPFQEAVSYSMHESQSRFWENIIGRSQEFCEFIYPELKKTFPLNMKKMSSLDFYRSINKSVPNLIRVESCELYYNLHIIIRFEIEEIVFNQGMEAHEIPFVWNEKYKSYLGLSPKTFSEGVLQDSHWAGAGFGYFPTYTLGNLISGSLRLKIKNEMKDFDSKVRCGEFSQILNYLKEKIHSKGRSITSKEIIGKINVDDYLLYLKEKLNG